MLHGFVQVYWTNRVRRQSGFPTFISCQRQDAHVPCCRAASVLPPWNSRCKIELIFGVMLQFNVVWCIRSRREIVLTIQSDNGKQGYKVGGKNYRRPKVVLSQRPLRTGIAAIGFGDATNPELAAWPTCCPSDDNRTKVTNSVTSARSLWWHVGPYFWPADLTRTANPINPVPGYSSACVACSLYLVTL